MKKSLVSLIVCMTMVVSLLSGCSASTVATTAATEKTAATTAVTTAVTTVATTEGKTQIKVGFVMKTQNSPYFVSLVDTIKKLTTDNGWDCTILDSGMDTAKEAENMETLMSKGVQLIFLDSVEPDACIPSINAAAEANIPVINLDSGVGKSNQCTTIYSDNKQNGRMVGLAYGAYFAKDKEIVAVLLSALKGNIACLERRLGLYAGIIEARTGCTEEQAWVAAQKFEDDLVATGKATNKEANFTLRGQGWGDGTREGGLKAAEDLITANKDLTCVLGENDQMLFGAMTALDNAGIKGVDMVAAADGAKEAYDLIKQGKYFGTGENSPYKVAELGMKVAKEILVDGKDWKSYPDLILTEAVAVTKDNVDAHYEFGF